MWCNDIQVNVNGTDHAGISALHTCACYGGGKAAAMLIDAGALPDAVDNVGSPPIFYACQMGNIEVIDVLASTRCNMDCRDGEGRSLLHWVASAGHFEACVKLIELKACPINADDSAGRTALHTGSYLLCSVCASIF